MGRGSQSENDEHAVPTSSSSPLASSSSLSSPASPSSPLLPPAPWQLSGSGAILLYRFPKAWALERGLIPTELRPAFVGGLGAVMLVDYSASPVGPYREALFIPGLFRLDCGIVGSVTRIVVSSEPSVVGGWVNWGLPKEGAAFERVGGRFAVWQEGVAMLDVDLLAFGPQLPVSTTWSPAALRIAQWRAGRRYVTQLVGKGAVQPARLRSLAVNADLFPDVSPFRPLLALRVAGFALTFPQPEVNIAASR